MKILLVDDDPVARQWLAQLLRPHARKLLLARDGEEAWALLAGGTRPCIAVVDVWMPRMGGLELLRRVRGHAGCSDLPVILVANVADPRTQEEARALGASTFLLKPHLAAQARCVAAALVRQSRRSRSEHFLATLRRTAADLDALERSLCVLRQQLYASAEGGHEITLETLHTRSADLGLRRCADLVRRAASEEPAQARSLLRECAALVQDQLDEIGCVTPDAEHRLAA
jgi:CheY-like chemotaxis protein